jgi:hypothetical protein
VSVGACPALRPGYVAFRAHTTLCGVTGVRFRQGLHGPALVTDDEDEVTDYRDPAIAWIQATQLARSLHDGVPVDLERL